MKIELIDWHDSCSHYGWKDGDTKFSTATCQSVGFLHSEDKQRVTIALNRGTDGHTQPWGDLISIPKSAIVKRRKIMV